MRALVTGSAGFLGRHFVRGLTECGFEVVGIDLVEPRQPYRIDCRWLGDEGHFDLIVHCAAIIGGREAIDGTPVSLSVNLDIDASMFRWATRTKQGRFVYISSSAVYPVYLQNADWHPALAESRVEVGPDFRGGVSYGVPDSVYGWTKLTGEVLAGYAREAGLPVTVIRPFSGYGEDQAPSYPFRAMAERAKARKDPFEIWGDGTQVRDFIHVDDIVGATLALALNHVDGPVNLSSGRPTSVQELAETFCQQAGYAPAFALLRDKPSGVAYRVGSNHEMCQWRKPRISLEEGIARALAT